MSYHCGKHGWRHLLSPCPSCQVFYVNSDSATGPTFAGPNTGVNNLEVASMKQRIAELELLAESYRTKCEEALDALDELVGHPAPSWSMLHRVIHTLATIARPKDARQALEEK